MIKRETVCSFAKRRRKAVKPSMRRKQAVLFQPTADKVRFITSNTLRNDGMVDIPKFFLRMAYNRCRFIEGAIPKICWYYDRKNKRGIFSIDAFCINDMVVRDENGVYFERIK